MKVVQMKALKLFKRRISSLLNGKGQVSLEWMMIAGAVVILAVILIQSVMKAGNESADSLTEAQLRAKCNIDAGLEACPAGCEAILDC